MNKHPTVSSNGTVFFAALTPDQVLCYGAGAHSHQRGLGVGMDIPWSGKAIAYLQGDFAVAYVAREDITRSKQGDESELDAVARCILSFIAAW